jgi:hypothetical protein
VDEVPTDVSESLFGHTATLFARDIPR